MRILIATDAWRPQVNGVVNTYEYLSKIAPEVGLDLQFVTPHEFTTVPCPTYPEIRLALSTRRMVEQIVAEKKPDFIHIATEGPIGLAARRFCVRSGRPFTTSYHTRFPEYVSARLPLPIAWSYRYIRWFHARSRGMMVVTKSLASELKKRGFENLQPWSRGVNTELFRPRAVRHFGAGPIYLYVGRVAAEKNIAAFLNLKLDGRKVVVGSGPQLATLKTIYPDVLFLGPKYGEDLAECYASADVLVFPSLTDTFGNVMLEALASGVPVAAFPVTGPKDLIEDPGVGILDHDLGLAARRALELDRTYCRDYSARFSWLHCLRQFVENILRANKSMLRRSSVFKRLKIMDPCRGTGFTV